MSKVVPRPTNLSARVSRLGMRLLGGWRFEASEMPPAKAVMLAVPHTSNLDGLLLVLVTRSIGLRAHWMVKDFWLRPPFGWVTSRVGAVPVDRRKSNGMVGQMVERFESADEFRLLVPPEGTRSRTDHWKSGFYQIALEAGVQVMPAYLDYQERCGRFGEPITMTGDRSVDMEALRAAYEGAEAMARYPDKFGPIRLRDES